MDPFYLRDPVSALSHGLGMVFAMAGTWALMSRLRANPEPESDPGYRRGKVLTLLAYGLCMTFCYGASGLFHALRIPPGSHNVFHRLDHVGIYLLIAGSYTPVAWSMMSGPWRSGTLTAVWIFAAVCAGRVWMGGLLPIWMSTVIYMSMGWAALGCYRDLMRRNSQRVLYPLPFGGLFYTVGALINLSGRPSIAPGVFGSHELFHCLVLAGSACHFHFMIDRVVLAREPGPTQAPASASTRAIPMPKFLSRRRVSQKQSG